MISAPSIMTDSGGGGSFSSAWGSITGTLSSQTDLQTALDNKLTGSGPDTSVARWLGGALTDSTIFDDGSNAQAMNGFAVNGNVTNNGTLTVYSGTGSGVKSFYVGTNNDIVTTRYNVLDYGDGSVALGDGPIFTVGNATAYGLGIQVAQNGPALFRIIQLDATLHNGIWSWDAEGNALYWGTSNQNYAQILRSDALGGVYQFNIMYGIIDSYQTMQVHASSVGIRMPLGIAPVSMFDIAGNLTLGVGAAGVTAAPTNGLYVEGDVQLKTTITKYGNVTTTGKGVPAIYGYTRSASGRTAAVASVATYTLPATDGTFLVSSNVLVTTATLHSFTVTCTYTDEGNTSRTVTMPFSVLAGTFVTAITNAQGAVPYEGLPIHIRAKASTAITIATTGTFTTVTYNVEGNITQIA